MTNELIFIAETLFISLSALGALFLGKIGLYLFAALCWVIGNIFILKQVTLFGFDVVTTDIFAVGCDLAIVLLKEHYSEQDAKKSIALGMLTTLFFLTVSRFLLLYTPNVYDTAHPHFEALFNGIPRIIITGVSVAALSKSLNIYLLRFFSNFLGAHQFKLKTTLSLSLSQFFDTVLFSFIALYGTVESVWSIIGFSCIIKLLSIFICVPLVSTLYEAIMKYKKSA